MNETRLNFILTPCGTSLLMHSAGKLRGLVTQYSNTSNPEKIPASDRDELEKIITRASELINQASLEDAVRLSAELNAIIKFYEQQLNGRKDLHQLICTDTWLGEKAAHLVAEWLGGFGLTVDVRRQRDLQTACLESFQLALSDLVEWCEETLPAYRASHKIIFNLTGGFKSVQGFLQTLASFYADETIYIFESGNEVLRIPRLPIKMAAADIVNENLIIFRRLSLDLPVTDSSGVPEIMLLEIDNQLTLSPWGELVWQQTKKELYSAKIHPPSSNLLQFGKNFLSSAEKLPTDRKTIINERFDQLVHYLEKRQTGQNVNLASLDLKKLKVSQDESTHEFDAWADQDAKRIFCHFKDNILVLDRLTKGLH